MKTNQDSFMDKVNNIKKHYEKHGVSYAELHKAHAIAIHNPTPYNWAVYQIMQDIFNNSTTKEYPSDFKKSDGFHD